MDSNLDPDQPGNGDNVDMIDAENQAGHPLEIDVGISMMDARGVFGNEVDGISLSGIDSASEHGPTREIETTEDVDVSTIANDMTNASISYGNLPGIEVDPSTALTTPPKDFYHAMLKRVNMPKLDDSTLPGTPCTEPDSPSVCRRLDGAEMGLRNRSRQRKFPSTPRRKSTLMVALCMLGSFLLVVIMFLCYMLYRIKTKESVSSANDGNLSRVSPIPVPTPSPIPVSAPSPTPVSTPGPSPPIFSIPTPIAPSPTSGVLFTLTPISPVPEPSTPSPTSGAMFGISPISPVTVPITPSPTSSVVAEPSIPVPSPTSGAVVEPSTPAPSQQPTEELSPPLSEFSVVSIARRIILELSPDSSTVLDDTRSNQYLALLWISFDPSLENYSPQKVVQRWVLATLFLDVSGYFGPLSGPNADINYGGHNAWMTYDDECSWMMTSDETICNESGEIEIIQLNGLGLEGTIPTELSLLSDSLVKLNLGDNQLHGRIPTNVGLLSKLTRFQFTSNMLSGPIPTEVGNLAQLEVLGLGRNDLSGSLPTELGLLQKVGTFGIEECDIEGPIPPEIGNMISLKFVSMTNNRLSGNIPHEIAALETVTSFKADRNALNGEIPKDFCKIDSLIILEMDCDFIKCPCCTSCCEGCSKLL